MLLVAGDIPMVVHVDLPAVKVLEQVADEHSKVHIY